MSSSSMLIECSFSTGSINQSKRIVLSESSFSGEMLGREGGFKDFVDLQKRYRIATQNRMNHRKERVMVFIFMFLFSLFSYFTSLKNVVLVVGLGS